MGIQGFAVWVGLAASLFGQDVVLLRSGAKLEGQVVAESTAKISMAVPGGTMELNREDVASIERGKLPTGAELPASMPAKALLAGLHRFADAEDWFLLERGGKRIGWRVVTSSREVKRGVAAYLRRDRIVIPASADGPEIESIANEWVDATLKPIAFSTKFISGSVLRTVDGTFLDSGIELVERAAGLERKTLLPCSSLPELPGFLLRRRGTEPNSEQSVIVPIFDPRRGEVVAGSISKSKVKEGATSGSRVRILDHQGLSIGTIEVDSKGRISHEELGGADLVAVRTDPKTVSMAIAQGFSNPMPLKRIQCPEIGVTFDRPDDTWVSIQADSPQAPALSLWHPKTQSSVEFFAFSPECSVDEIMATCAVRITGTDPTAKIGGAVATTLGDLEGFKITVESTRRGRLLSAFVFVARGPVAPMMVLVSTPLSELGRGQDATQILATLTKIPSPTSSSAE